MSCYGFTPYQRLWLYNGAPLVAFYDTLGIRRTYSRLKPPASSRGRQVFKTLGQYATDIARIKYLDTVWVISGQYFVICPVCAPLTYSSELIRLGYCLTPYQRMWLYNGAPLVAFYNTLGIRRTYSRLKPPASSRGSSGLVHHQ